MEQAFCQSCGMPMAAEFYSTNKDGSENTTYCNYCYKEGEFTSDITMEEMIRHCVKYLDEYNGASGTQLTEEEAVEGMRKHFPTLLRWKK